MPSCRRSETLAATNQGQRGAKASPLLPDDFAPCAVDGLLLAPVRVADSDRDFPGLRVGPHAELEFDPVGVEVPVRWSVEGVIRSNDHFLQPRRRTRDGAADESVGGAVDRRRGLATAAGLRTASLPHDAAGYIFLSMVGPKGGAAWRPTAAACPVWRRGREPAKWQVASQGAALWWMPIHPDWNAADGSHQPRGALLTHVAGPLSSPFFTHRFCRGATEEKLLFRGP